jgi:hypothetical protein
VTEVSKNLQYIFFGKVHPERCLVSIPELRIRVVTEDREIDGDLVFYVSLSQIIAIFSCDRLVQNYLTLKNSVEDLIRTAIDALGYTNGCGYDIEIIEIIDSLGNSPTVFGVGIPAIRDSAKEAGVTFQNVMDVFRDPRGWRLKRCLADLREAIRVPQDTGFFCYRGIESLRQFFKQEKETKDDKQSWEILRTELGVDRSDLDEIKKWADPLRHGDSVAISDAMRASVFRRTWSIVNKFIKYANAGYKS